MLNTLDNVVFEYMTEVSVPDVMHEDSCLDGFCLAVEDKVSLLLQTDDGFAHEVHGTEGVLKASMPCSGIDYGCQSQLVDARQPLHERMPHDVEQESAWNLDESEDRVVDDFSVVHSLLSSTAISSCSSLAFCPATVAKSSPEDA